ncbi:MULTISPECIES: UxaA family hydrolase [Geobacillus]|jgi:altronate dehydratase small subunit|uniref:UxaA family hydrolase n=1 Tax=Geobacillus thermodenitrificans TaxID=33940 RepID=A0ABY9Q9D3_GEOTD|nr:MULTISPECIES: UxaA family hydrolase [Geobacillus]ARP43013.1 Altronate dehydratase [Geobacillus thermodenitrificans]ATO35755.1 D-galactarate dehydratase [Geobacillus thermodenitrificans]MEC5186921.1 altronate dehydratase small subunit [Geobacillus thermodenitrificans]MED0661997.1 D-galactarate dehydratase [Geobacillus thermodenitrificans]NNU88664.1 D-galactarate dehydratase [Geobacillus sp. MR]
MSSYRFVILNQKDNVATALDNIPAGSIVKVTRQDREYDMTIKQNIEFGHKFAIVSIKKGEDILKYGEVIGVASSDIAEGEHVHVHNVEGKRGRGDKEHEDRSILGV